MPHRARLHNGDVVYRQEALWLDWWDRYYLKGVEDPDYTIIRLIPKHLRHYHKLQPVAFDL